MKLVNIILFAGLLIIAIYLLYKLIAIEELSRTDNILMIVFLAGSLLHSAVRYLLKKKKGKNNSTH